MLVSENTTALSSSNSILYWAKGARPELCLHPWLSAYLKCASVMLLPHCDAGITERGQKDHCIDGLGNEH